MDQSVFHESALEHTLDQPDNSFVSNPMTQKLDHPFVVNLIEKASNIGFHNVVDIFLLDRSSEHIQALVWTAPRTIAIAVCFKHALVDRFQDAFNRLFHDLVFKVTNTKRTTFRCSGLRHIAAPFGSRTKTHPFEPVR